jgi:hypothetical protein
VRAALYRDGAELRRTIDVCSREREGRRPMQTEHGTRSVWPLLIASAVAVGGLFALFVVDHGLWDRLTPSPIAGRTQR